MTSSTERLSTPRALALPVRQTGAATSRHGRRERARREPARAVHPPRARGARRGTDRLRRPDPDRLGRRRHSRAGPARGGDGVAAPLVRAGAVHRRGIRPAHRLLQDAAASAGRLPRPLAVRAAPQPHDAGHQHAAAVDGLRHRAAGGEHADDPRRHGTAIPLALGPRGDVPHRLRAAVVRRLSVREDVRHACAAEPDKAGDLATSVEESVHGVRVLKAFGRGSHALHK